MALHGKETSDGAFLVQDVLVADLPPQVQRPISPGNAVLNFYKLFSHVSGSMAVLFLHFLEFSYDLLLGVYKS